MNTSNGSNAAGMSGLGKGVWQEPPSYKLSNTNGVKCLFSLVRRAVTTVDINTFVCDL